MGMESPEESAPKVKLNAYGELIGGEEASSENGAGYINEKGEFIRGKDKEIKNATPEKNQKENLPVHLL